MENILNMMKHIVMNLIIFISMLPILIMGALGSDSFNIVSEKDHKLTILNDGLSALKARIDLIRNAKESILVEYFIYNTDQAGKILTTELVKKAKEGVKVKLLLDHFMIGSEISPFHVDELEKVGIEVRFYNTLPLLFISRAQYRNHRKLFVVDNKVAIVGGRNIGDDYFDLSHHYNFLDRDMIVEGEIVKAMSETFYVIWDSKPVKTVKKDKMPSLKDLKYRRGSRSQRALRRSEFQSDLARWKRLTKEASEFLVLNHKEEDFLNKVDTLGKKLLTQELKSTSICKKTHFSSDRPGVGSWTKDEQRVLKYEVFKYLNEVKEKLIIDSPYFIVEEPTGVILKSLLDEKQIEVKLLTNGLYSTDAIYVANVFNTRINKWLKKGLTATIYSGDVMPNSMFVDEDITHSRIGTHSKSFVFDHDKFFVGSYNFDPRSNYYSLEMGVFCDGNEELTNVVKNNIEARMNNGFELKNKDDVKEYEFYKTGILKKLGYYLTLIPASLFDHLL